MSSQICEQAFGCLASVRGAQLADIAGDRGEDRQPIAIRAHRLAPLRGGQPSPSRSLYFASLR